MQIVVLASRKGGAGKTTLAAHFAVEAEKQGAGPVAIIDADPMSGLSKWWNKRGPDTPVAKQVGEGGLPETLAVIEGQGFKLLIIDTPPAATEAIAELLQVATIVILPVTPSPNDLWAIGETLEMVPKEKRMFVLNNASASTKLTKQARGLLRGFGRVADTTIATRQDYRTAMIDGRTAPELSPNSKASDEIKCVWSDISGCLEEASDGAAAAA